MDLRREKKGVVTMTTTNDTFTVLCLTKSHKRYHALELDLKYTESALYYFRVIGLRDCRPPSLVCGRSGSPPRFKSGVDVPIQSIQVHICVNDRRNSIFFDACQPALYYVADNNPIHQ